MQNIYNSVKSGGLKVFIGAGKKCQRIKNHVLGCRILDSSSEGVKIPGPINFWWFWSCCICVTVTVHHFSSIQVLYRPLRPKWAIPPPITIQNMRFIKAKVYYLVDGSFNLHNPASGGWHKWCQRGAEISCCTWSKTTSPHQGRQYSWSIIMNLIWPLHAMMWRWKFIVCPQTSILACLRDRGLYYFQKLRFFY